MPKTLTPQDRIIKDYNKLWEDALIVSENLIAVKKEKSDELKQFLITSIKEVQEETRKEYQEALIWCSGSQDFQVEGKAREGWEKICLPLLKSITNKEKQNV